MKRRVKRVYKKLPPHTYEAHPVANAGEASKPLIIGIIALVAVILLSLLLLFSKQQFAGKAIYAGAGTAGIIYPTVYENQDFTLQVKANVGNDMAASVSFELTLPTGVSCKSFVDNLNWPIHKFTCDPNLNTVTYSDVTNSPVSGELTVASITFNSVKAGTYDFKFAKFDVKKADKSMISFTNKVLAASQLVVKVPPTCGNGVKEEGELCDGADLGGATCASISQGFTGGTLKCATMDCKSYDTAMCTIPVQPQVVCGNGDKEGTEQCDDGNVVNGDGCSSTCMAEQVLVSCGNAALDPEEQCDDGNPTNGDGCSSACMTESGYICAGMPSVCQKQMQQVCTPKQYECESSTARKQCNADGTGYIYAKDFPAMYCDQGQICNDGVCAQQQAVCGNGVKEGTEQCDDKNVMNGDGCSSTCMTEAQPQQVCTANQYVCEGTTAKKQCKADGSGYNAAMNCASGETCSNGACGLAPVSSTGKKIMLTDVTTANNVFSTTIKATETFANEVTVYTILYNKDNKVLSIKSEKVESGLAKDAVYTATVNYPEANVKKKSVIVYDVEQNPSVFAQLQVQKS